MEYMRAIQKKRRHEGDLEKWNACQAKRACDGVGDYAQVEYGAVADCPMDTWESAVHQQGAPNGNGVLPLSDPTASRPPQCCPRCLAGEPGHINHIMGY
ncbi:uncharacterized protein si:ch211-221j21.3 [Osmerus eperlanus]|uniref:uncharacterized protein si:ch211-221j21.3 n=1 Tax=Osmerus eperlanus TaxID=29151 RepID=UPI002E15AE72